MVYPRRTEDRCVYISEWTEFINAALNFEKYNANNKNNIK